MLWIIASLCAVCTLHSLHASSPVVSLQSSQELYREYHRPLSSGERNDIRMIVTTLANHSIPAILFKKDTLENAGERIDSVHPLKFLETIFSDEELKAGAHSIRSRPLLWKDFFGGTRGSLQTESENGNLNHFIPEFAMRVGIKQEIIAPLIYERKWDQFMEALLKHIPRSSARSRYDN